MPFHSLGTPRLPGNLWLCKCTTNNKRLNNNLICNLLSATHCESGWIVAVHNVDEPLAGAVVVPPQSPDSLLTTDIPYSELNACGGCGFNHACIQRFGRCLVHVKGCSGSLNWTLMLQSCWNLLKKQFQYLRPWQIANCFSLFCYLCVMLLYIYYIDIYYYILYCYKVIIRCRFVLLHQMCAPSPGAGEPLCSSSGMFFNEFL